MKLCPNDRYILNLRILRNDAEGDSTAPANVVISLCVQKASIQGNS